MVIRPPPLFSTATAFKVVQKSVCEQVSAVLRQWCSCCEGEVVHLCDGLDRMVESGSLLPAITQDLVVLHPGEGMLDAGTDPTMLGVVFLLTREEWPAGPFSVRDDQAGVK